ncbi:hypothetical protein KAR91_02875 [Candidatus Pacearchaeota archaeon]|nr:hypothetical protein [Candidatus Pacearchaeota archaeon]
MKKSPSTSKSFLESLKNPLNRFAIIGVLMGGVVALPTNAHAEDRAEKAEAQKIIEKKENAEEDYLRRRKIKFHLRQFKIKKSSSFIREEELAPYPMCLRKSYGRTCALADNSDNSPKKSTQG